MMDNNKYYTPGISDLFIGYECETHDTWEWRKVTITEEDFRNGFIRGCGSGNDRYCVLNKLRTPFLTKEQLIKELPEWEFTAGGSFIFQNLSFHFRPDWLIGYYVTGVRIFFHPKDTWMKVEYLIDGEWEKFFEGSIPSINEFMILKKFIGL